MKDKVPHFPQIPTTGHTAQVYTQSCADDTVIRSSTELWLTLMSLYLGSNFFAESTVS